MTEPTPEDVSVSASSAGSVTRTTTHRRADKPKKQPLPVWQESLLLLAIALVLAIGIKYFFVQAFYIPSPSMQPEFIKNDRILVQKVSYWGGGNPKRGDIVVFKDPGGWLSSDENKTASNPVTKALETIGLYPSGGHLVKRVIGVGGDRIVCDSKDELKVNGKILVEPYVAKNAHHCLGGGDSTFDIRVPQDHLWVMGDNRDDSYDSRGHMGDPGGGYVADNLVVGKVWALIWPWKRAERIHTPATFKDIPNS
ncbi:MAG: signal peptidase I [Marmoricola sp.]